MFAIRDRQSKLPTETDSVAFDGKCRFKVEVSMSEWKSKFTMMTPEITVSHECLHLIATTELGMLHESSLQRRTERHLRAYSTASFDHSNVRSFRTRYASIL